MWKTIKNLLQKGGGRCIIIEDGQPSCVVLDIKDYENLLESNESSKINRINRDIAELRAQEKSEPDVEEVVGQEEVEKEEVKVEDLPF